MYLGDMFNFSDHWPLVTSYIIIEQVNKAKTKSIFFLTNQIVILEREVLNIKFEIYIWKIKMKKDKNNSLKQQIS